MKQLLQTFIAHKDLYALSLSVGGAISLIIESCVDFSRKELFGLSLSLWLITFFINVVDIHTGIKADTARKKRLGEKFIFQSKKGWRAFEKIVVFTLIIWFLYTLEVEAVRLDMWSGYNSILISIKFILIIYVVLIELQSIGENEQERYGTKSKVFTMLDNVINIVNDGILTRLQNFFSK